MSRRQELLHHRHQLAEARQIIGAMQSLAFIEVRRLRRVLDIQRQVVDGLYGAAQDFLAFHSDTLPAMRPVRHLFLILGSERGFCGDFNAPLLRKLEQCLADVRAEHNRTSDNGEARAEARAEARVIACGRKLIGHLEGHPQLAATFDGASVFDEVASTLARLSKGLAALNAGDASLTVIYHSGASDGVTVRQLLPPFEELRNASPQYGFAPQLNIPPAHLLAELTQQYLFAVLHSILYESLMAENHRRMQHLEGAVRHLDRRLEGLTYQENQMRQEEIIEEIEVILLNQEVDIPPQGS